MFCPECGKQTVPGAAFCGECGTALNVAAYCPECGTKTIPGTSFCGECGTALAVGAAPTSAALAANASSPGAAVSQTEAPPSAAGHTAALRALYTKIDALMAQGQWGQVLQLVDAQPQEVQAHTRMLYYRLRSLHKLGRDEELLQAARGHEEDHPSITKQVGRARWALAAAHNAAAEKAARLAPPPSALVRRSSGAGWKVAVAILAALFLLIVVSLGQRKPAFQSPPPGATGGYSVPAAGPGVVGGGSPSAGGGVVGASGAELEMRAQDAFAKAERDSANGRGTQGYMDAMSLWNEAAKAYEAERNDTKAAECRGKGVQCLSRSSQGGAYQEAHPPGSDRASYQGF